MRPERRLSRTGGPFREKRKVNIAIADSKRLIDEIDILLEHSRKLMDEQAVLHRHWRG